MSVQHVRPSVLEAEGCTAVSSALPDLGLAPKGDHSMTGAQSVHPREWISHESK